MIGKLIIVASILLGIGIGIFTMKEKELGVFEKWKLQHQKQYLSQYQGAYRKSVFEQNLQLISTHNQDDRQSYKLGLTQFADLTLQEFSLLYLGAKAKHHNQALSSQLASDNIQGVNIDWEQSKKVSPVKNQLMCGSCWAFSAVGSLESKSLINNRSDILSEQQLVDCSTSYGNEGCHGGWMQFALDYVKQKGITTSSAYPYTGKDHKCSVNGGRFKISGYTSISGCDNMLNSLSKNPVSVAVDATYWALYQSGVFSNCSTQINHGVLLIGATDSYWRIKNSWDSTWGEQGYMRLARGNTCDICHYPTIPNDLIVQ